MLSRSPETRAARMSWPSTWMSKASAVLRFLSDVPTPRTVVRISAPVTPETPDPQAEPRNAGLARFGHE